ncbi:uncharacterized protein LOC116841361, partial [Odontomachus brunneus]|uniref:uncharacterized protein LOC116841361 n=1 Tax=Odontomachus brunneus TaxID=486640 RepID=UPI0013F2004F
ISVFLIRTAGFSNKDLTLCCRVRTFLTRNDCVQSANDTETTLPLVDLAPTNSTASDEHFSILVWNLCAGDNRYSLNPHLYEDEQWHFLSNDSVYRPEAIDEDRLMNYDEYCLARVRNYDYPEYLAFFYEEAYPMRITRSSTRMCGMIISVPFVYVRRLLAKMRNIHGLTLRGYVGCLSVAYVMLTMVQLMPQDWLSYDGCIAIDISIVCDFFF